MLNKFITKGKSYIKEVTSDSKLGMLICIGIFTLGLGLNVNHTTENSTSNLVENAKQVSVTFTELIKVHKDVYSITMPTPLITFEDMKDE